MIGFVGYSFGAHLATYLAAGEMRARALAVFGGVGVAMAARHASKTPSLLQTRLFRNWDDQVPDPSSYCAAIPWAPRSALP
jgi:dienelactone hydrolase